jgi:hypothetical protein
MQNDKETVTMRMKYRDAFALNFKHNLNIFLEREYVTLNQDSRLPDREVSPGSKKQDLDHRDLRFQSFQLELITLKYITDDVKGKYSFRLENNKI